MPKLIATGASPSEVGAKAAKSEPILTWDNLTYSVNNGAKTIIDDCSGEMYSTLDLLKLVDIIVLQLILCVCMKCMF
jgi:hypothetical protein